MIRKGKISNGVKAIVLRAAGINCDLETEQALELAGAKAERVHINRVIGDKSMLEEFQILVFPGGFSYGDDVAAGKILANQIVHHRKTGAWNLQRLSSAGEDGNPAGQRCRQRTE